MQRWINLQRDERLREIKNEDKFLNFSKLLNFENWKKHGAF